MFRIAIFNQLVLVLYYNNMRVLHTVLLVVVQTFEYILPLVFWDIVLFLAIWFLASRLLDSPGPFVHDFCTHRIW